MLFRSCLTSLADLFSLLCCFCCSFFSTEPEDEGLVDKELRLRQTIRGADDLCSASNESDLSSSRLGWDAAFFGAGGCGVVESDFWVCFVTSLETRDRNW